MLFVEPASSFIKGSHEQTDNRECILLIHSFNRFAFFWLHGFIIHHGSLFIKIDHNPAVSAMVTTNNIMHTATGKDASSVGSVGSFVDVPSVNMDFVIKIGVEENGGSIVDRRFACFSIL